MKSCTLISLAVRLLMDPSSTKILIGIPKVLHINRVIAHTCGSVVPIQSLFRHNPKTPTKKNTKIQPNPPPKNI